MIEIIALLEIKNDILFKEFEDKAVKIMQEYNGNLLSAFDINYSESSMTEVGEVHYLTFPDLQAFNDYRADPQLLAMSDLRKNAISNTTIFVSNKFKQYGK